LAALDSFFKDFGSTIADAGNGANLVGTLNGIKFKPSDVTNITRLSEAIRLLGEAIKELPAGDSIPSSFSSINDLLGKAEALKDLAKILSASSKERKAAAVEAGLDKDKNLEKSNAEAEKYIDNLTKYYSL